MIPLHVLGDADTVRAFQLAGVPGTVVDAGAGAGAALDVALRKAAGADARAVALLLLVTERVADAVRDRLEQAVASSGGPVVIEIPGIGEPLGTEPLRGVLARALRGNA